MNELSRVCCGTVFFLCAGLGVPASGAEPATGEEATLEEPAGEPARTWTSLKGVTIEGTFARWERGLVVLLKGDGKSVRIRPSALSPEDQAWLKENAPPPAASSAPKADDAPIIVSAVGTNFLPHYASGPWANMNAVYEHPNFDAVLEKNGQLKIFPKVNGKRVGNPMSMYVNRSYYDKKKRRSVSRRVLEFESPPAPTMRAREIVLNARLEDDVVTQINYEFKDNTIAFGGHCIDPKKIRYPTSYEIWLSVPQSITVPKGLKRLERRRFLSPYKLQIRRANGDKDEYPFWMPIENLSGRARDARILGPLYGERKVKVRAKSVKRAPLGPWIYPWFSPWQGFRFSLSKESERSKSKTQRIILEIE